jgi:hypothetical protein
LYSRFKGYAAEITLLRFRVSDFNRYTSLEEAFADLDETFIDPARMEITVEDFRALRMQRNETFAAFKPRFLTLAGESEAPQASLVNELYNKFNEKLKDALAPFKHEWGTSFSTVIAKI